MQKGRRFDVNTEITKGRDCGTCDMCCTTLDVTEIGKPAYSPCQFLKEDHGCKIYHDRPGQCEFWSCGWLMGIGGDHIRPDKVGFVLNPWPMSGQINEGDEKVDLGVGFSVRVNTLADMDSWKDPTVLPMLLDLSVGSLIIMGFKSHVFAAIFKRKIYELSPMQMAELETTGYLWLEKNLKIFNTGQEAVW